MEKDATCGVPPRWGSFSIFPLPTLTASRALASSVEPLFAPPALEPRPGKNRFYTCGESLKRA